MGARYSCGGAGTHPICWRVRHARIVSRATVIIMPELPEVETTVRDLRPHLIGRTITRARVTWERTVAAPNAKQFTREIVGYKIVEINRRGKYLVFGLSRQQISGVWVKQTTDDREQTADDR
ncbi:MAG: hypothetical protein DCC52_12560 [Chloroflexi bacterium]|nr:MAG: hypothetical protein DCC52_12560 [Chloroflexota bacterium]